MVSSVLNIALSGLKAEEARLSASANNVANQFSTSRTENNITTREPYRPQEVVQSPIAEGGTRATVVESNLPPVETFDPSNPEANAEGIVALPDISLGEEFTRQLLAENAFRFNLRVIESAKEQERALLEVA